MSENIRAYNVGSSNYAQHKIQPWDIWLDWMLNPWEADIVKRVLRVKEGQTRREDFEKIIHIAKESIRQIDAGEYFVFECSTQPKILLCDIMQEYGLNEQEAVIVDRVLCKRSGQDRREDFEQVIHAAQECIRQIDEAEVSDNTVAEYYDDWGNLVAIVKK